MAIGANGILLSNDVLAKWLIEHFPYRIQLAPFYPFLPITGHELRYANTGPLTPAVPLDFCAAIPEDTKAPIDPDRVFPLGYLATHFRICYSAQDRFSSNVNDQTAVQMALAIRELLYEWWTLFEAGDSVRPGEPDGLLKIVDPLKVVDLACGPVTLERLSQARERVRTNNGQDVDIVTTWIGKLAIEAAHWVRGLEPKYEMVAVPNSMGGTTMRSILTFDDCRVWVNDLNQIFECPLGGPPGPPIAPFTAMTRDPFTPVPLGSNIWFFVKGEGNLHGITPAALGDSIFTTRSTILPDASTLVYHVTMAAGQALGSACALAVLKDGVVPT